MKKIILFSFSLFLFVSFRANAQLKYPVSAIPTALLKDAHVVLRSEEISIEIESLTDAVKKRKFAITILDEAGQDEATMVVNYDMLHKVTSIEGALYDAAGNQLKKVKSKDINDYSATSGINIYDDNRVKVHDFDYKVYPYTVEYEVETKYNNTYIFPEWIPQSSEHFAVEQSSYTIVTPANYTLRYKAFNYKTNPTITTEKDKKIMKWEVKNLSAITKPFASPLWHELTPTVFIAPSEFVMQGYKGDASTWQEFGKFQLLLNANRDKLPPAIEQKVAQLTEGITDTKEKIKRLYEYLQQNTRYISIQLGIGGLQPFEASYVAQKGYGDCKALSNYMYSLLKAADIKSYYTWIHGGYGLDDRFLMDDFPFDYFNHIVLCIPLQKDTMWLECTSQIDPAGYMGGFTGNRKALAITEDGGKLVATPHYGLDENVQLRKINGTVDEEGNLQIKVNTKYKAQLQDRVFGILSSLSKEKVKKILNEELEFSTYDVNNFSYNAKKDVLPEVEENLDLFVANYAIVSGKRLFIVPNLMTKGGMRSINTEDRTCDFVFENAYRDIDSIEINLPPGYQLEAMPQPTNMKTSYGNYSTEVKVEGSKIICYRKMERFAGRFPAKEGEQIAKFYNDIYKADRSKVVLVKKEG